MGKTVELNPAYVWDCDECGLENFERARRFEASEEDIAEMRDEHGVEDWDEGEFLVAPTAVMCRHCGETFDSKPDGIVADDDDPTPGGPAAGKEG